MITGSPKLMSERKEEDMDKSLTNKRLRLQSTQEPTKTTAQATPPAPSTSITHDELPQATSGQKPSASQQAPEASLKRKRTDTERPGTAKEFKHLALQGPSYPSYQVVLRRAADAFLVTEPTNVSKGPRTVRLHTTGQNIFIGCTIRLMNARVSHIPEDAQEFAKLIIRPDETPHAYAEAYFEDVFDIQYPECTDLAGTIGTIPESKGRTSLDIANPLNGKVSRLMLGTNTPSHEKIAPATAVIVTFKTYPSGTWTAPESRKRKRPPLLLLESLVNPETDDLGTMRQLTNARIVPITANPTELVDIHRPITSEEEGEQLKKISQHLLAAGTYANATQGIGLRQATRRCKMELIPTEEKEPDWRSIRLVTQFTSNHQKKEILRRFPKTARIHLLVRSSTGKDEDEIKCSATIDTIFLTEDTATLTVKTDERQATRLNLPSLNKICIRPQPDSRVSEKLLQELRSGKFQRNLSQSSADRTTNYHLMRTLLGIPQPEQRPLRILAELERFLHKGLDESQLEAALAALNETNICIDILAAAGSGKSRTIAYIALALLAMHCGAPFTVILTAASNQAINNLAKALDIIFPDHLPSHNAVRPIILRSENYLEHTPRVPETKLDQEQIGQRLLQLHEGNYGFITKTDRTTIGNAIVTYREQYPHNAARVHAMQTFGEPSNARKSTFSLQLAFEMLAQRSKANLIIGTIDTLALHEAFITPLPSACMLIDEAGSVSELRLLGTITRNTKRLIQIGDIKQLGPFSTLRRTPLTEPLTQSGIVALQRRGSSLQKTLKFSYRAHPMLTRMASNAYYERKMKPATNPYQRQKLTGSFPLSNPSIPFIAIHHPGKSRIRDEGSRENSQQCELAIRAATAIHHRHRGNVRIAILTAYRGDKEKTLQILQSRPSILATTTVDTIDAFQGQEEEIVILVLGVEGTLLTQLDHLNNIERATVALTRAKDGYVLISDLEHLAHNVAFAPYLNQLALNDVHFYTPQNLHLCLRDNPYAASTPTQPIPFTPLQHPLQEFVSDIEVNFPDN